MKIYLLFWPSIILNVGLLLILAWLLSVDRPFAETSVTLTRAAMEPAVSPMKIALFARQTQKSKPGFSGQRLPVVNHPPAKRAALHQQLTVVAPITTSAPQYLSPPIASASRTSTAPRNVKFTTPKIEPGDSFPRQSHPEDHTAQGDSVRYRPAPSSQMNLTSSYAFRSQYAEAVRYMSEAPVNSEPSRSSVEASRQPKPISQPVLLETKAGSENSIAQMPRSRLSQHLSDTRDKKTLLFSAEQQQQRSMIGWQNFYYEPDTD